MEMKRLWICLLALLVLVGCGGNPTDVGETLVVPQSAGSYCLNMETEWMEYDPSVDSIWCILSYEGEGEPLEFGAEYRLEVQTDSGWEKVPWKNEAWEDILYTLPAGEFWAFPCVLSLFDYDFTEGTYRVVKDLEVLPGEAEPLPCWAEFTLRKGAAVSAEAPYGFGPMEEVPEYGDPAELAASGAVVFTEAGTENADAAEEFLNKVSLGIPCQLRTLQSYYESWPMLIDVVYENGSFLWRMRTGGEITEKRFSYIVTDRADAYLSNGADWTATEAYDSDRAFLVPSGSGSGLLSVAQELMGGQTTGNTAWYRVWTQDGGKSAFLTRTPTEFGVEGSDSGSLYDLEDWYDSAPSITGLAWQADGTLRLTCETAEGGTACYDFDLESGYLTEALCGLPTAN